MITLNSLTNSHRPHKKVQRIGRGPGSGRGKTCGRGNKGDKARCGYKQRYGEEGGQKPLYKRLPCRGFASARFRSHVHAINLSLINSLYNDGEVVNHETLREKGYAPRRVLGGIKILSQGELQKKVTIEAHHFSKEAQNKLQQKSISFKVVSSEQE
jgi:large subunit ribosomal protein L15